MTYSYYMPNALYPYQTSPYMPELLFIMLDGDDFDEHIGSIDVAMLAEKFIKNNKGDNIGFRWTYDDVINMAKNFVDLNETEFYPTDIFVWANVKYGDMGHIIADAPSIIRIAISELMDDDYPFCEPSQRAYYWLKNTLQKVILITKTKDIIHSPKNYGQLFALFVV